MTSRDFCYWLQGVMEVAKPVTLDAEQVALIKSHLSLVFIHEIDPSFPAAQQPELNAAHAQPLALTAEQVALVEAHRPRPNPPVKPGDRPRC